MKIFLKTTLTDELAFRIDSEIRTITSEAIPSRKGRDWNVIIDPEDAGGTRPFQIHLWDTSKQLWDCKEDLKGLGMSTSELPSYIVISAECNQEVDRKLLEQIVGTITTAMDGFATGSAK